MMDRRAGERYREFTPWALWLRVLLVVCLGGAAVGVWVGSGSGGELGPGPRWAVTLGMATLGAGLAWFLGGLTTVVERDALRVGLGRGWPVRTEIPFHHIKAVGTVTYRPLMEFGGWGLRGSPRRRVWSARGNRALVLTLDDGREVYVGSDDPDRLEARLRNAMSAAGLHPG